MKNNLRELRKRNRWSQAEIGKRLGMAHNTVSLYESGRIEMNPEMLANFAKALEVSPEVIEIVNETEMALRDERSYYGSTSISLELLSDEQLHDIDVSLSQKLPHAAPGVERGKMQAAIEALGKEKQRRAESAAGAAEISERAAELQDRIDKTEANLTSALDPNKSAAVVGSHALKHAPARAAGTGERARRSGAGERTSRKDQPRSTSDHPSRPPRPAGEEEGRK